jgi:hypothetical protein
MMQLAATANLLRSSATTVLSVLSVVIVGTSLAPRAATAANTCNAFLSIDYPSGPTFAQPGDIYRVGLEIGTGSINGGTQMQINRVRFQLDCNSGSALGTPCTDDGALIEYQGDGTITTTCPSTVFSTGHPVSTNPNEVLFTPNAPILIPANTPSFCRVEFDIKVLSITDPDPTPAKIEEVAGYLASTLDAVCDNNLQSASSQSGSIDLCPMCTDTECSTSTCNPDTGMCELTPKGSSTPCGDTDGDSCTTAGCDGLGNCNQSHMICVTTTTTSSTTTTSTSSTTSTTTPNCIPVPEDCDNTVDDDCDGLIDCLDPDCVRVDPCPTAKKDPTDIRFGERPSLDRLRSKAILQVPALASVDLCTAELAVLLTNPHGAVHSERIRGSVFQPCNTGTLFRYRNLAARTDPNGGLYKLKLRKLKDKSGFAFSTISYADLAATNGPVGAPGNLEYMRVQFYIGDSVFITLDNPWKRTPTGWRAPKDH